MRDLKHQKDSNDLAVDICMENKYKKDSRTLDNTQTN